VALYMQHCRDPVPELYKEIKYIVEILLSSRRHDNGTERNAKKRERENKYEYPEDRPKHGS
jgi:hypothetical protein